MFSSLRSQIAIPFLLLIGVSLLLFGFLISEYIESTQLAKFELTGLQQAALIAGQIKPHLLDPSQHSHLESILDHANKSLSGAPITILTPDGNLLAQGGSISLSDLVGGLSFEHLPEVIQAQSGSPTTQIRRSQVFNDGRLLNIAYPIQEQGELMGILFVAYPLGDLDNLLASVRIYSVFAAVLVGGIALVLATLIASRTFQPLRSLTQTAQQITEMPLRPEVHHPKDDVSQLTLAFNNMSVQLRSQIEALKTERSKISAVLQQMTDGVVIADSQGRVQLLNRAAENMFSIQENDALGRTLAEVLRDYRLVEMWERCMQTSEEQSIYLEFRHPNLFLQSIALPLDTALPGNVLLLFQDLTRLRRLETVRRDFISNISHELRTPLASLKALAETLQDGALEDPPAARRFLSRMETEVDTLTHMVSELLELSRIESGKVPLQLKAVRPRDLLIPPRDRLVLQAERNDLSLQLDCPDDLPLVLADTPRMQQVIVNLLHNAIKFTPPGGAIVLSAREENGNVCFSVQDTGVGIPSDDLPRIFERFYKADRARSGGGTGLGLAISRHLVEAHGGKIWAESRERVGSTFSFTLLVA